MKIINFMGIRRICGLASVVAVILSIILILVLGVKRSVDFEGGTNLTVTFREDQIDIGRLRNLVSAVDSKASIVRVQAATGSMFSIKIKNPDVEVGKEAEASLARLKGLEHAFANIHNDNQEVIDLLKTIPAEKLGMRLLAQNPFGLETTDLEKVEIYKTVAGKVKASLDSATSPQELAMMVDPDRAPAVEQGLSLAYPALNRATIDLINAFMSREDPLNRGSNGSYLDVATEIDRVRQDNLDFLPDFDTLFAQIKLPEGEDAGALKSFITGNFTLGHYRIVSNETFSPSIAAELLNKAWGAILLSLLGILLYVSARFNRGYAIAAVVALAHDVTIALGCFALVGAELSNPVVAAFLTIVGYSLNDTIVVFDRIRDNLKTGQRKNVELVMNESINQTLSRTVVTSMTTLFVVICIFIASNQTLRDFAFPLLIGITVGTYSSIFVASPILLFWNNRVKSIST